MNPGGLRQVFGSNVRRLREREGFSHEALADMAGANRSYLSRLETGLNYAGLRTIGKLAGALGIDPADLLRQPMAGHQDD
jgi:transcriptional regulator with XRE-family HTH domain